MPRSIWKPWTWLRGASTETESVYARELASITDPEVLQRIEEARLKYAGTCLTQAEAEELIAYECVGRSATPALLLRKYVLTLKCKNPALARQLERRANAVFRRGGVLEQQVRDLRFILAEYDPSFWITLGIPPEKCAEVGVEYPRPLKTLTERADNSYQVWHMDRSIRAQWKAWRQGRPWDCGYGMTEEEAIEDLRYCVSPDPDGTLDGLGTPKGPFIGGNMLSREEIIRMNKQRFE